MKRRQYLYHVLCSAILFLGSCSDSEDLGTMPANPGDAIRFSAAIPQTRTHYSDRLQIDWNEDDEIGIYSAQANTMEEDKNMAKHAKYKITKVYTEEKHAHHGDFAPTDEAEYLKWGSYEAHTFYGAYPADRIVAYPDESTSKGQFIMKYATNQCCTVSEYDDNNSIYLTEADMKNAYMMAKNTLTPNSTEHVLLNFHPVMTTLEITIKAGKTGEETGTGLMPAPTTITGVSVIMPKALKAGQFVYDVDNGQLKDGTVTDNTQESVFVTIEDLENNKYLKLDAGKSVSLLAFLPPIPMDGTTGNAAKIRVHTTGYQNFVIPLNGKLEQESKITVPIPDFDPERIQANNWMTYLDDKIYLSQLSVPGAYAATSFGSLQNWTMPISSQLGMGIRAFDLSNSTEEATKTAFAAFESFLESNPKECIIAVCGNNATTSSKSIEFSPNLNLGAARGHILILPTGNKAITRNAYTNLSDAKTKLSAAASNAVGTWSITDCAKSGMAEKDIASTNKSIYEHIVDEQKGSTGIVMTAYVCSAYSDKYTEVYGDLLSQSIIDCNYKFVFNTAITTNTKKQ